MKKKEKNILYITVIIFWILLVCFDIWYFLTMPLVNNDIQNSKNPIVVSIFLAINFIFITVLFCNSTKDFIFIIFYHLFIKRRKNKNFYSTNSSLSLSHLYDTKPKVILLYTTCNDFDQQSLIKSAQQNYENYDVYILDDSYDKKYIKQIDEFVKKYKDKFKLIRRENREGLKQEILIIFWKIMT